MCGRYTVITKLQQIEKRFNVQADDSVPDVPRANIGPGAMAPVISSAEPDRLQTMRFGMTPSWFKKKMLLFNARSEGDHNKEDDPRYSGAKGIISKPSFRKPIRSQRCLVPADAFIEGPKQAKLNNPFLIYMKSGERPFAFAGLWDEWVDQETGEVIPGFSIITTVSNKVTRAVGHHRSPVILPQSAEQAWLDTSLPLDYATDLLQPFPGSEMNAYPLDAAIKNPRAEGLDLLQPVGERVFPEYTYSFSKELELFGMGESRARKRRQDEGTQGSLF